MAFRKFANARVTHPRISSRGWGRVRTAARKKGGASPIASHDLASRASEILGERFDPDRYLLSHATIVASVDVEEVQGAKLGKVRVGSKTIDRRWGAYYINPACSDLVNNNGDAWSRKVLLASYPTFIGSHNFCFAAGTGILLSDGTYKAIEEVQVGDRVVTHTGACQAVTHKFERDYEGDIHAIGFDRFKDPVLVTGNHPFRGIQVSSAPVKPRSGSKASSTTRYYKDQVAKALRGDKHSLKDFKAESTWVRADQMRVGDRVLGPVREAGTHSDPGLAELLGYYLAEGCPLSPSSDQGFVLAFGHHEVDLARRAESLAYAVLNPSSVTVATVQTGIQVRVYSAEASRRMVSLGGHRAADKRLSEEVFSWDEESLLRLLAAWLAGDGNLHKATLRLRGTTTSEALAQQMQRVAELAGVKSFVMFEPQKIGEVQSRVVMTIGGEDRSFDVVPRHHVWTLVVSKGSTSQVASATPRWGTPLFDATAKRKRSELAWWGGCRTHRVASNETLPFRGKVYNIEVEGDHSYVIDYGIAVHNCEHVQVEELSKGRIIDAAARDIGRSVYVDILVATDRKHTQLVTDIESGKMGTLSMGCTTQTTQCTKCGNVAVDDTDTCDCIRYHKLDTFYDSQGQRRVIAELCFPPGIRVSIGDGSRVAIEDLQVGDVVLSHTGHRREVVEIFERDFDGDLVALDLVGLPQTLRSTPNHPFWVISQNDVCACGCGIKLKSVRKTFARGEYTRKYAPGHNPTNVVSLDAPSFDFVEAGNVRVGDMVAMPAPQGVVVPEDVDEDRARLLGWFLAEGCYIKKDGQRVGIQLTLNAEDEVGVAEALASLLSKCFTPEFNLQKATKVRLLEALAIPATTRQVSRRLGLREKTIQLALSGLRSEGLVSSRRLRASEKTQFGASGTNALVWERLSGAPADWFNLARVHCFDRVAEPGKKLVVCYTNRSAADWFYKHAGEYSGSKRLSEDAILWPKTLQASMLRSYLWGDGTVDTRGRHSVSSVSETLISQMQVVAARCGFWTRRQVIFEGQCVELQQVVNGTAVPVGSDGFRARHELHIQPSDEATAFFGLTEVGSRGLTPAWRTHEGYMLYRVRDVWTESYKGKVHNIAVDTDHSYLAEGIAVHNCGHHSLDDTGGVVFIEASWVGNPAFKGAVLRNVLSPTQAIPHNKTLQDVLSSPPPTWTEGGMPRAAALAFDFGDPEDGEEEQDSPKSPARPLDKTKEKLKEKLIKDVREDIEKDLEDEKPPSSDEVHTNDNLHKQAQERVERVLLRTASSETDLINKVALLDAEFGCVQPRDTYLTALRVGGQAYRDNPARFLLACQDHTGRRFGIPEVKVFRRLGSLLSLLESPPNKTP